MKIKIFDLKIFELCILNSNISAFYESWNQYFGTVGKRLSTFKFIDRKFQEKIHRYYGCRIPLEINEKTLNRILEFSEKKKLIH